VGKKSGGKKERFLGPATVVKPALIGATGLLVVQVVMRTFLHA